MADHELTLVPDQFDPSLIRWRCSCGESESGFAKQRLSENRHADHVRAAGAGTTGHASAPDVRYLIDDADRALAAAEAGVEEATQRLDAMASRLAKVSLQAGLVRALAAEREVVRLRAQISGGVQPAAPAPAGARPGPLSYEYELQVMEDDGAWVWVLAGPLRTATDALTTLDSVRRRNPDYKYRATVVERSPARPIADADLDALVLAESVPGVDSQEEPRG